MSTDLFRANICQDFIDATLLQKRIKDLLMQINFGLTFALCIV
jgi:hypothetical protein